MRPFLSRDYEYYFKYFFLHVVYWLYYFVADKDFCINDMNSARLGCIIPFHPLKSSYPAEDRRRIFLSVRNEGRIERVRLGGSGDTPPSPPIEHAPLSVSHDA